MVKFEPSFLAVGGNRHPAAADWDSSSGYLAFGADNNIALWDPLDPGKAGIRTILSGHTDRVNALKLVSRQGTGEIFLISGSVDRTLRIWTRDGAAGNAHFEEKQRLEEHTSSINCLAVNVETSLLASGSADGTVKLWRLNLEESPNGIATLVQSIVIEPRLIPLCLAISSLSSHSDARVLAVAGTGAHIQLYVANADCNFEKKATLSGHEGWIRSLAFTSESGTIEGDLLLASASQDKYIRLWRLHQGEELPPQATAASDPVLGSVGKSLSNKAQRFQIDQIDYSVTFEALLLGHEDWIFTVSWKQGRLLSASADDSLAIWGRDSNSGIWICESRLGEISAQKGATTATGSTGGFWNGLWSPTGDAVVCLGRTGSWRVWTVDQTDKRSAQCAGVSGHARTITGICWAPDGQYLLSTSSDQTTRLFAKWQRNGQESWHEFARPQIHGYDLNCIDVIGDTQFVSGADEKLLRVFDEPKAVSVLLSRLCNIGQAGHDTLPETANIPVLGLSNKAMTEEEERNRVPEEAGPETDVSIPSTSVYQTITKSDHPPLEDHLARHTLWPEAEKLYGHGFEISAVACSHNRKLVATACRASSIDHAVIRLFETESWTEIRPPLAAHTLTIARIRFSEDDQYIVSVGRDRQWAVFEKDDSFEARYRLVCSNPKGHSRMILDVAWAPLGAGRLFASAARDKTVKIWAAAEANGKGGFTCKATIQVESAATAVDVLPHIVKGSMVVAIGTDAGAMQLWRVGVASFSAELFGSLDQSLCPSKAITQLCWRPSETANDSTSELAAASEDSSLRIFTVSCIQDST